MNDKGTIAGVLSAIVGLAVIAVIVSKNSDTPNVFGSIGSSFGSSLRCAMSPIIGGGNCGTRVSSTITF